MYYERQVLVFNFMFILQAQIIGLQTKEYKISRVGDATVFESQLHGFLIVFDKKETVKIVVGFNNITTRYINYKIIIIFLIYF